MVTFRGFRTQVQYGAETAYGSGATPNTAIKGKISTISLNLSNNLLRTLGLGDGRNETAVLWGNFDATWNMNMEVAGFEFLQHLIGPSGGSGTAGAPYYLEETDFMGYTGTGMRTFGLEIASRDAGATNSAYTLAGCVINSATIDFRIGETVKVALDGFARTATYGTTCLSFTPDTTNPWTFSQGSFSWNGSTVARVTSASVSIVNNFDPNLGRQLGSRFPEAMEPGARKYDWTLTCKMTDTIATTLLSAFLGGSATTPNAGTGTGSPTDYAVIFNLSEGSASGNRNAQVKLSNNYINNISTPINIGENIVEVTITGNAKKGTLDTVNKPIIWWTV